MTALTLDEQLIFDVAVVRGPGVRERNQIMFQLFRCQKAVLRSPKLKLNWLRADVRRSRMDTL